MIHIDQHSLLYTSLCRQWNLSAKTVHDDNKDHLSQESGLYPTTSGFFGWRYRMRACVDLPQIVEGIPLGNISWFWTRFDPNCGIKARTRWSRQRPSLSLQPCDGLRQDHFVGDCVDLPLVVGSYYIPEGALQDRFDCSLQSSCRYPATGMFVLVASNHAAHIW